MRISGLTVNPSPEDTTLALDRLEVMMSELEMGRNICMNYNFEEEPDPNTITNVPKPFWYMIQTNLALRLIPDFNKQVPQTLMNMASQALSTASSMASAANARQLSYPNRMPVGSGTSQRYNQYQQFNREQSLPPQKCATNIITLDDVNDYQESFQAYLGAETIASFTIIADQGLILVSNANNDPIINYRVKADNNATDGVWQQVKIIITTSTGRIETRKVSFEIRDNETVNNN